jgi:hypothetical protein
LGVEAIIPASDMTISYNEELGIESVSKESCAEEALSL